MEASTAPAELPRAGIGLRLLAILAALILAFLAAVAIVAMSEIGELTPCGEVESAAQLNDKGECFDGGSTKKTISLVLGWPGAVLAALSVLLMLAFAVRGRGGRMAVGCVFAAAMLFGLSILVGSL